MKILLCHNHYQTPGGEDRVFTGEGQLLETRGHEVVRYTRSNDDVNQMGKLNLLKSTIWNRRTVDDLKELIRRERPAVAHFTNTFPLISPSAYYAAREEGVAVVQSLHNYRYMCPKAVFYRKGSPCEDCQGKTIPWPSVLHACYKNSRSVTAATAAMIGFHKIKKTWARAVDCYIALSEFSRAKFTEAGFPADRIVVKPNFVQPDPGIGTGQGGYAVYAGRLVPEKGIDTLLAAWSKLSADLPLKVAGDGPLADSVKKAAQHDRRIEWLGWRPADELLSIMGEASLLVMPSEWYETFGLTVIEAFAKGTPVVASRIGAVAELVDEESTGLLFESGNPRDLADKVDRLVSRPDRLPGMRVAARRRYEDKFTAAANYEMLIAAYEKATGRPVEPWVPLVGAEFPQSSAVWQPGI